VLVAGKKRENNIDVLRGSSIHSLKALAFYTFYACLRRSQQKTEVSCLKDC
jgi:hypothetical protein